MLTSCSHLLLPKKVQSILTVSPVWIGRLQEKCISICYSKKRGFIPQCQIFLGRCQDSGEWRTELLTKPQERKSKKKKKKQRQKKEKKAVSLPGKQDFRWEYVAGSSRTTDQPNPVPFPEGDGSTVPIQVPGIPRPEAFLSYWKVFFLHKGWYWTAILKALRCGWLGC